MRQVKKRNIIIKIAFAMAAGLHWVVAWPCRVLSKVCDVLVGPLNWSVRLALLCVILGCVTGWCGLRGFGAYMKWVDFLPVQQDWFDASGLAESARTLSIGLQLTACGLLLGALLAFCRRRFAYHLLKVAAAAYVVMWLGVLRLMYMIPSAMFLSDEKVLSKELRNYLWVYCTWVWLPLFLLGLLLLLCLCFSDVTRYYRGKNQEGALLGDRIIRSLRTHGEDPTFRVSSYWSTFLHIFVIFMIPLLLGRGCRQKPYGIPKGIGQPVAQLPRSLHLDFDHQVETALERFVQRREAGAVEVTRILGVLGDTAGNILCVYRCSYRCSAFLYQREGVFSFHEYTLWYCSSCENASGWHHRYDRRHQQILYYPIYE